MTAPNMATIAASLERSMQNCSLNNHRHRPTAVSGSQTIQGSTSHDGTRGKRTSSSLSSTSSTTSNQTQQTNTNNVEEDRAVELNSNVSLSYHWEQCLDLKTGEIYYLNWRTGMKAKEDPRTAAAEYMGDCYYSDDDDDDEEEEEEEDEDDSSYDSEESSTESSPSSSRDRDPYDNQLKESDESNNVLVVAGCKTCLMYYMVPKHHEDCPKCNAHLLHFDRSQTN